MKERTSKRGRSHFSRMGRRSSSAPWLHPLSNLPFTNDIVVVNSVRLPYSCHSRLWVLVHNIFSSGESTKSISSNIYMYVHHVYRLDFTSSTSTYTYIPTTGDRIWLGVLKSNYREKHSTDFNEYRYGSDSARFPLFPFYTVQVQSQVRY